MAGLGHNDGWTEACECEVARQCGGLAESLTGVGLLMVAPTPDGWQELPIRGKAPMQDFCALIQSTEQGRRHCEISHVLMSVAACSAGPREQTCHAGAHVVVHPVATQGEEAVAVLSDCICKSDLPRRIKGALNTRIRKLGLPMKSFLAEYGKLPKLSTAQCKLLHDLMATFASGVREARARLTAEEELRRLREMVRRKSSTHATVEEEMRDVIQRCRVAEAPGPKPVAPRVPLVVSVVESMVRRKPGVRFTVAEIATAARITPNHFSALFRTHTGRCFSEFLTEQRINAAKKLLPDLSLSIAEVAQAVGYDDASYFTRRFRQQAGVTPGQWRNTARPAETS